MPPHRVSQDCIPRQTDKLLQLLDKVGARRIPRRHESGGLKVVRQAEGRDTVLDTIAAGDIVGEMAFLTGARRSATVIATEPSRLVGIELRELQDYLDRQPVWLRKMIDTVVARLRETSDASVGRKP